METKRKDNQETKCLTEKISVMQPEILILPTIQFFLGELGVTVQQLNESSKQQLVSMFLEHISPKPQRKYKHSKFFQKLSSNQRKFRNGSASSEYNTINSSKTPSTVRNSPPPQSCIDFNRKKIKLSRSEVSDKVLNKEAQQTAQIIATEKRKTETSDLEEPVEKKAKHTPISWP